MDVILNDYSIDSQFPSVESFVDSLAENTLPTLECLKNCNGRLLKSYETYSRKITDEETIYSFLHSRQFGGFSEIQKLRSLLGEWVSEPYWEDDSKTEKDSTYSCKYSETFSGEQPNCFSEALERDGVISSLQHPDFQNDTLELVKNGENHHIYNIYDKKSMGKILFLNDCIGFTELLMCGHNKRKVCFFSKNGKYYADEYFDNGRLSKKDAITIKEDFDLLMTGRENGNVLNRFTDSITHKKMTYCEFRCTLSDKKQFRIFYYVDGEKWVFFDSLMKTTSTTPNHVKDQTYDLIKQYKNMSVK